MYKLYLDDLRVPIQSYPLMNNSDWRIVRSYDEFVKTISSAGLPNIISFDHDLAFEHYRQSMYDPDKHYTNYYTDGTFKEKTGFECAKWLVEYCISKKLRLPEYYCHSANPIGKENILSYLKSFEETLS